MNFLKNRRKAVSPVIATMLLIALTIAGGVAIAAVLNNIESRTPSRDENTNLGNLGTDEDINAKVEIQKLSKNQKLADRGIDAYTEVKLNVKHIGSSDYVYIMDFDILVYGQKLDEVAAWKIQSVDNAVEVTNNGEFAGYRVSNGNTATFDVGLDESDINKSNARIPDETDFVIESKIGSEPGLVTNILRQEILSKIVFNNVFYRVGIIHHGSTFADDTAAKQFEDSISSVNGTNNLFFLYDRSNDTYDYNANPNNVNVTEINQYYDVVIVDSWAVPSDISTKIKHLYYNGTNLIFYGSLSTFSQSDRNVVLNNIDSSITENVTGLDPNLYDPSTDPGGRSTTDHSYDFISSSDLILKGISGENFEEIEANGQDEGDQYGFDQAKLTTVNPSNFTVYGTNHYRFISGGSAHWDEEGPLLVYRPAEINETGEMYSFVWKHNEDLAAGSSAQITDQTQLNKIRKNMLTSIFKETDRTTQGTAELSIDSLTNFETGNGGNDYKWFRSEIQITVVEGNVDNSTLEVEFDMPDALDFKDNQGNPSIRVEIDDGQNVDTIDNIDLLIGSGNIIEVDIGSHYSGQITEGSVITIYIPTQNDEMKLDVADTQVRTWTITATYDVGGRAEASFDKAIDNSTS